MATKMGERPTLPSYTSRQSFEIWEWRNDNWHNIGTRSSREDAIQLAESRGYPFWAVINCKRQVEINTVED